MTSLPPIKKPQRHKSWINAGNNEMPDPRKYTTNQIHQWRSHQNPHQMNPVKGNLLRKPQGEMTYLRTTRRIGTPQTKHFQATKMMIMTTTMDQIHLKISADTWEYIQKIPLTSIPMMNKRVNPRNVNMSARALQRTNISEKRIDTIQRGLK